MLSRADLEGKLSTLTTQHDAVAEQIIRALEGAEFNGQSISFKTTLSLLKQAGHVLEELEEIKARDQNDLAWLPRNRHITIEP